MTLGDKIRKYRTLKGLTQAQLGSMVKLTGDRIRQYENDVRKPKDGKLMEIAKALDINPTALFEPDYRNPNSVMHALFELEDIYGLRFEKSGENYQLVFSQNENGQNSGWLMEGQPKEKNSSRILTIPLKRLPIKKRSMHSGKPAIPMTWERTFRNSLPS